MKAVIMASMTIVVNILAFFKVVASSQISPHFHFRAAKIIKISDMQTPEKKYYYRSVKYLLNDI